MMFDQKRMLVLLGLLLMPIMASAQNNPRETKVREDKKRVEAAGFWLYNDLPAAFAKAKQEDKPIIVVLRCIPCEECVKLDDDLVDEDPELRPLLEKFVRVRVISTNGLDLSLFQFDYDQSFAVFFLNADKTIYGRFGTRSHRTNWVGDVSIPGLRQAMTKVLDWHQGYPRNQMSFAAKLGDKPKFPTPEKYPTLGKFTNQLDYAGKVVPSCIHCHQVGDAIRDYEREKNGTLSDKTLFPYPHPKSQGLILDPKDCAKVLKVDPASTAAKAGFQSGDEIESVANQPLLSIADLQWVLQQTSPDGAELAVKLIRDGKPMSLTWNLPKSWRETDNISWRVSSWGLRRMALGGMVLEEMETRPAGIRASQMAFRVKNVGQYGLHATAKKIGVKPGDILVSFAQQNTFQRETDLLAYAMRNHKAGEKVEIGLLRNGKFLKLQLPQQK